MEKDYWLGRWQRGDTGWHQTAVDPALVANFSDLQPTRVFVPLCGKSLDLVWLAERGHEVIGVEFTELAIRAFFSENKLSVQESRQGDFTRYQSGKMTILQGDFFKLKPEDLGSIGAVYDRAALIALSADLRRKYATHMIGLLGSSIRNPSFRFLEILMERKPHDEMGPPHSVLAQELSDLYGSQFDVVPLKREDSGVSPLGAQIQQCIYSLNSRS